MNAEEQVKETLEKIVPKDRPKEFKGVICTDQLIYEADLSAWIKAFNHGLRESGYVARSAVCPELIEHDGVMINNFRHDKWVVTFERVTDV